MDEELDFLGQETDIEDAIEAFMKSEPKDVEEPSDDEDDIAEADEAEDDEEEADPEEAQDDDEQGTDDDEDEGGKGRDVPLASDDAEVAVVVDGKELRVSVKELKRLYGQEAALTQKSQALAAQRKAVEAQSFYVAKLLQDRYEAAKARAAKYAEVDLFRAARELDTDEFEALKAAKEAAESEVAKLEQEGQNFLTQVHQTKAQLLREQAKEALKTITKAIPDWNDELYGRIRTYAISQGMDADTVNEIVDPSAILMIHKAMKFDEAQSAAPKVQKKVKKAPKRVVRKGDAPSDPKSSKLEAKRRAAMVSGDIDDVAELFLAAARD